MKNIIVYFDNDLAGVKGAHRYKKQFNCRCIFIKKENTLKILVIYIKSLVVLNFG